MKEYLPLKPVKIFCWFLVILSSWSKRNNDQNTFCVQKKGSLLNSCKLIQIEGSRKTIWNFWIGRGRVSSEELGFSGIICPRQTRQGFHHKTLLSSSFSSPLSFTTIYWAWNFIKKSLFSEVVPFVRTFEVYPLFERSSPSAAAALKYVLYCWVAPKRIDRQRRNSQMIRKHIPLSPPISISGYSLHICQVSQLKIASCTWKDWCNNFFLTRCRSQCHIFTQWHCQCA